MGTGLVRRRVVGKRSPMESSPSLRGMSSMTTLFRGTLPSSITKWCVPIHPGVNLQVSLLYGG